MPETADPTPPGAEADRSRGVIAAASVLERSQDLVSIVVGALLIILAAAELISAVVNFCDDVGKKTFEVAGLGLLDQVLLVFILIEIVHTVVLSLRAHRLVPQPFIIVGLVAVVRKVLVVLSGTEAVPTAEFALLLAMVAVFVIALIAFNRFGGDEDSQAG